jgi:arsenate reductase
MSSIKVYHYPKCSTCKAALRFLSEQRLPFEAVDISETPPSLDELRLMLELKGSVRALFNTSGLSYREGRFSEKMETLSLEQALEALASDGMLVKRPFLIAEGLGLLGFKVDEWRTLCAE